MRPRFYPEVTTFVCCVSAVFCTLANCVGQERGDRVVVIAKDAAIDSPARGSTAIEPGTILVVRSTRGNWVRVDEENGGWLPRNAVMPLDAADTHLQQKTLEATAEFSDFHALAQLRGEQSGWQSAVAVYDLSLKTFPDSAMAYFHRGMAQSKLGNVQAAIADYEKALALDSTLVAAMNNLAWIRATGDAAVRDGKAAVELANRAREMTKDQDSSVLDTLAAAHAELGQFTEAAKWQVAAIRLKDRGAPSDALYARLKLYSARQAFRAKSR
jgi:tetratricopeptide (TPR) repeat protein